MEKTRKIGKSLVIGVVLVVLLATAGLVFAAGNQAQEEGALNQLWDLAPAGLGTGTDERTQDGDLNTEGQPEHLFLYEKDSSWNIVDNGAWGRLVFFSEDSPNDEFVFGGYGLDTGEEYTLIYYPDPWPGNGLICLGNGTPEPTPTTLGSYINIKGTFDFSTIPIDEDLNPGAKIWLVLSSDVDCTNHKMIDWHQGEYLFENNLINPEDNEQNNLLENAVEVAPGVFYLGESMDKGKVVEGYAFVHYAKGYEPEVLETGDLTDDTSSCYKIIWPDIKWANVEHYVINPTNDFGLDGAKILNTFKDSVSTWEYAGEGEQKYDIIGGGTLTTDVITGRKSDGINMVRFANLGRGIIAMNIIWTDGTNLVEWDQTYSNKFDWSLSGEAGKMDFQNIATHELGHAVGLGDLYSDLCKEQTMYGYSKDGEITKRDLGDGDILGIQKLYGE